MTALLIEAVTSDFFLGFVAGAMAYFGLMGWASYRSYKRDTIAIRAELSRMETLSQEEHMEPNEQE